MSRMTEDVLLGEAIRVAKHMGLQVCFDNLDGVGSSPGQVNDERWVVLDRHQSSQESLAQMVRILEDHGPSLPTMSDALSGLLRHPASGRKAA